MTNALAHALDLLFPPQCLHCSAIVPDHGALCVPCWQQVRFITDPFCGRCGLPFDYAQGDALCGQCLTEAPPFSRARAVFRYDDRSRSLVLKFKYHDQTQLAPTYGEWLAKTGKDMLPSCDVIVPVPLYYWRFVGRRYNQAALLAAALSKKSGLIALPDGLVRTRNTQTQTGLSRAERLHNMQGAFRVHPKHAEAIRGKSVLLIDDVMTTGVTVAQCARTLLKAGAKEVQVLTLARTAG